ncbi:MAG: DUF1015 domain-containing protein [Propionibacteriaceae bacterium]|jgi:uncharacterized protein (DUF1015 family)|nr:DUF1015 domain-containing protein [Propionibacteriaceae bacterium]
MPRFEPFAALRYPSSASLDEVLAPPYDVLSEADVDRLQQRANNITLVDVPRGGADRYQRAAQLLGQWIADGVLVRDETPTLTIYRMSFTDATGTARTIAGVLGGLAVVDYGSGGGVLPHERTTPKASTDRLDLTRATGCNLSPVWGLSLASGLTDELAAPAEVLGSVTVDGAVHSVERISDPDRIARIQAIIAADDILIADGHHRYGVAQTYRDEVRAATGRTDTAAESTLTFVNELRADQLSIEAIHRLYSAVDPAALEAQLARSFVFSPAPSPTPATLADMVTSGCLIYLRPNGTASWMTPRPGAFDGVRALDGAYLEHALAGLDHTVSYQHGLSEMLAEVAAGDYAAGVLIRPTSLDEIIRTAREGLLMPPKSTFFTPKLLTGWVIRPANDSVTL